MRFVSFTSGSREHCGAVVDNGRVVDITARLADKPKLIDIIRADRLAASGELIDMIAASPGDHDFCDLNLLSPIPEPNKIWCIGVNFADRNEEYQDGSRQARFPSLFVRASTSIVGHEQPLVRPQVSDQLDYEGEIVLVIGRPGRHIQTTDALGHVFGLTLCNEGTVRDWLTHGKFNVTQGKNFDRSGSIGPWITTSDEVDLDCPLELTTRVNGEIRQHDTTSRMIFGFRELVAYLSTFATLLPGDLIVTGTPTGAGARFNPPKWLVPGDVVEVEVPRVGILRNYVVDE